MSVDVRRTAYFEQRLRRLKKKYPKIVDVFESLLLSLIDGEKPGDKLAGVGYDAYKTGNYLA